MNVNNSLSSGWVKVGEEEKIASLCNKAVKIAEYISQNLPKGSNFFSLTRIVGKYLEMHVSYDTQFTDLEKTVKEIGTKFNEYGLSEKDRKVHLSRITSVIDNTEPSEYHKFEMERLLGVAASINAIILEGREPVVKKEEVVDIEDQVDIDMDSKDAGRNDNNNNVIEKDEKDEKDEEVDEKDSPLNNGLQPQQNDQVPPIPAKVPPPPPGPGAPPPPAPPPPPAAPSEEDKEKIRQKRLELKQKKIDGLNEKIDLAHAKMADIAESLEILVKEKCEKASQRTEAGKVFSNAAKEVPSWKSSRYDCGIVGYRMIIKDLEHASSSLESEMHKLKMMQEDLDSMGDSEFIIKKETRVSKGALQRAIEISKQNIEEANEKHNKLQQLKDTIESTPFGFAKKYDEYIVASAEVDKLINDVKIYKKLQGKVELLERNIERLKGVKPRPQLQKPSAEGMRDDMMAQLRNRLEAREKEKAPQSISPDEIVNLYG